MAKITKSDFESNPMIPFYSLRTELHKLLPDVIVEQDCNLDQDIEEIQERLGIQLPDSLNHYHTVFDKSKKLKDAFNHVLAVRELYVSAGGLVFVEERERYYRWGLLLINLSNPASPVMQQAWDEEEWIRFSENLQSFLAHNTCWQALNLMTALASMKCSDDLLHKISSTIPSLQALGIIPNEDDDTLSFIGNDVICIAYPKQSIIYCGGSDASVARFGESYRVGLNWL
jgi:hypothetical protein